MRFFVFDFIMPLVDKNVAAAHATPPITTNYITKYDEWLTDFVKTNMKAIITSVHKKGHPKGRYGW